MKQIEFLLLKIVDKGGNISQLINSGLTYSQISLLINDQIKCGNIYKEGFLLQLTCDGKKAISEYYRKRKDDYNQIIGRNMNHYFEPVSIEEIYLPSKKYL